MMSIGTKFSNKNKTLAFFHLILLLFACSGDDTTPEEVREKQALYTCENGMAGPYPCHDYDLLGHIPMRVLANTDWAKGSDCWGWRDPGTGKEYVIMGVTVGIAFVDISDPIRPVLLGRLLSATNPSSHHDIKVYQDHAFIVSEAEGHGMQIFDLTKLRNISTSSQNFTADAHYTGFGPAHNLAINEKSGYAYVLGSDTYEGGAHFVNIADPLNPVGEGGFADALYSHDAQVVTYDGPDVDYQGREIFVGSNEDQVVIIDVSDKEEPGLIFEFTYPDAAYVHQGWFTEDQRYFLVGDEADEITTGRNTRTLIFDFSDMDNPLLHMEYYGDSGAIDHNGYIKNDQFFLANYTAGMRVLDISNIEGSVVIEEGFFDSFPEHEAPVTDGAWTVYPYFSSGNIVISDRDGGLFIVKKSGTHP